uniref:Uncharacterized protein n=1 Tax=Ralstonia solanacearum TaxID=305 RepID=A0A0S4WJA6_RALSL|nr:protein of unknown function [Ralstonia solanacearum]
MSVREGIGPLQPSRTGAHHANATTKRLHERFAIPCLPKPTIMVVGARRAIKVDRPKSVSR